MNFFYGLLYALALIILAFLILFLVPVVLVFMGTMILFATGLFVLFYIALLAGLVLLPICVLMWMWDDASRFKAKGVDTSPFVWVGMTILAMIVGAIIGQGPWMLILGGIVFSVYLIRRNIFWSKQTKA